MADQMISAAPAGQPAQPAAAPAPAEQTAQPQAQPQGSYVTSEQLNAAMDEMKRMVQSSTDKSYNRVQKMIASLKQAGIQNPTYEQAQAMLQMQEQSEAQSQQPEAQGAQNSGANPEAAAWIKQMGGNPSDSYWNDIYDVAQEAGVEMITRDDPEYAEFFLTDGKTKVFEKPRHFVRAFEKAFEAKKARLNQQGSQQPQMQQPANLASSPAIGSIGGKSTYINPKKVSSGELISQGMKESRR